MLILSRKLNESIVIDGRIIVKILRIERDTVKLGIQAPSELPVHRQEVYDLIQRNKQAGGNPGSASGGTIPKSPMAQVTPLRNLPPHRIKLRRAPAAKVRRARTAFLFCSFRFHSVRNLLHKGSGSRAFPSRPDLRNQQDRRAKNESSGDSPQRPRSKMVHCVESRNGRKNTTHTRQESVNCHVVSHPTRRCEFGHPKTSGHVPAGVGDAVDDRANEQARQ
jgi:carbon storage regulator